MNLTNYYWYFKSAIPERICDDIVKYGHQMQDQMAVTGGYGDKKLNAKQVKDLKKKSKLRNYLQNIKKASIMIGIVIAGINLINDNKVIHHMVKLENYL